MAPVNQRRTGSFVRFWPVHPPAGRNPAPRYLWAAEVAEILEVSPKTVSRWAKESKLPPPLAATGALPAAEIRQLADQLQVHFGALPRPWAAEAASTAETADTTVRRPGTATLTTGTADVQKQAASAPRPGATSGPLTAAADTGAAVRLSVGS